MTEAAAQMKEFVEQESFGVSPMQGVDLVELEGNDYNDAWDVAFDCVTYPVEIEPFHSYVTNPETGRKEQKKARGVTNRGRDTQFYGVWVDRNREGQKHCISSVTDTYGTLPVIDVYQNLRNELEEMEISNFPKMVHVSGNGGRQVLHVKINDMVSADLNTPVEMAITLVTSVDGTTKHLARVSVFNSETGHEIFGIAGHEFTVSARHTQTINDRHTALSTILENLLKEWNEKIMPLLSFMNDKKFDRDKALEILEEILEDAEIPEKHAENLKTNYNPKGGDTLLGMTDSFSNYFQEQLEGRHERKEQFRKNINKAMNKMLKRMQK